MKVFVLGATGVIGRRALPALIDAGHQVSALARGRDRAARVRSLGAAPVEADPFDEARLARALSGHEAVINVMTRIPPLSRAALPSAWRENDRLRREASGNVARAARRAGVGRLIQESIGFLYADGGEAWLDEDAAIEPAAQTRSAMDAEQNARAFGDAVVLRFGSFYGPESDQSAAMVAMARRGLSPLPTRPTGYVSRSGWTTREPPWSPRSARPPGPITSLTQSRCAPPSSTPCSPPRSAALGSEPRPGPSCGWLRRSGSSPVPSASLPPGCARRRAGPRPWPPRAKG